LHLPFQRVAIEIARRKNVGHLSRGARASRNLPKWFDGPSDHLVFNRGNLNPSQVMEAIGCEVVPLATELDYTFPKYNPNPEDMEMLHAIRNALLAHKADVGLGFDGDGDRRGVVDNTGEEIFADKVGVMLTCDISASGARWLRARLPSSECTTCTRR
jgi:hypothetical protein